jgi:transcriptional regulator with XRE-family HTH domain
MPRREDPQVGLGKAIRQLRNEAQLSQEALGEKAEINPTWGNVRRIARGLGVKLWRLAELAEKLERERSGT